MQFFINNLLRNIDYYFILVNDEASSQFGYAFKLNRYRTWSLTPVASSHSRRALTTSSVRKATAISAPTAQLGLRRTPALPPPMHQLTFHPRMKEIHLQKLPQSGRPRTWSRQKLRPLRRHADLPPRRTPEIKISKQGQSVEMKISWKMLLTKRLTLESSRPRLVPLSRARITTQRNISRRCPKKVWTRAATGPAVPVLLLKETKKLMMLANDH